MSSRDPTRPWEIHGGPERTPESTPWQSHRETWSFEGPVEQRQFAPTTSAPPRPSPTENPLPPATEQPQRARSVGHGASLLPARRFGRRSSHAVFRWEGEVEQVNGREFRARLTPSRNGHPASDDVEFTEFSFDEITPADHELIVPGALFYWTLARKTNEAGTLTNESLVRFRRIPPPGDYHDRVARQEAEVLLRDLGGNGSS